MYMKVMKKAVSLLVAENDAHCVAVRRIISERNAQNNR